MPIKNADIGHQVHIVADSLVNIYGCRIGSETMIGPFVEIQKNSVIGARCRLGSNVFICEGVTIGDDVVIGPGVAFTNDRYPQAVNEAGDLAGESDWKVVTTEVGNGAVIGANATILCGIRIGDGATIGAGAVVTRDVPSYAGASGVPARVEHSPPSTTRPVLANPETLSTLEAAR